MEAELAEKLTPYGAPAGGVVDLRQPPDARHVRYLDLIATGKARAERIPDGVVEMCGEPLAYVVDAGLGPADLPMLARLRLSLAYRAECPYLAVLEPGRLTVLGVTLDDRSPGEAEVAAPAITEASARSAFTRLYVHPDRAEGGRARAVHTLLYALLTGAVDGLIESGVARDDAISMTGRVLFTRFLVDRGILRPESFGSVSPPLTSPVEFFSSAESTQRTFAWLDRTFNGDFLPMSLPPSGWQRLSPRTFEHLTHIMQRSPLGQQRLDWSGLDFAHIPVGVLSEVYEQQAHTWDPYGRHRGSVYYTPRRIAEYMVAEVFGALTDAGANASASARVLDPAVGGGVFLVAAFREIVAARWRATGCPPTTSELRRILYDQLVGFDIHEPALRLAALSLYLTSLELDVDPHPVEKLVFEPLLGRVLFNVRGVGDPSRPTLGSLGPNVGPEHQAAYDVVVGNPPWTALTGRTGRSVHAKAVNGLRPLVAGRIGEPRAESFQIPDLVPDLPFAWRCLEWARPDGRIALALHGRLLFKDSAVGARARRDLFDAVAVTGVLNGADLRQTDVWPEIMAPFCLLFAVNRVPDENHVFFQVSPYREDGINSQGRIRIDSSDARPISLARLRQWPMITKALFRGNSLDASLVERIRARHKVELLQYWHQHGLAEGQGFQVASQRNDASALVGKPVLRRQREASFLIDTARLPRFTNQGLHRVRDLEIYTAPLLLVAESPAPDRRRARAFVALEDVAFNESFYGYSARGHPDGARLVRYLSLLLHTDFFLWYLLLTSSKFGVERDSILKSDIDLFPIVPIEEVPPQLLAQVDSLFQQLVGRDDRVWEAVDQWVASLYGLDAWDLQVIRDTLSVSLPFRRTRTAAQSEPSHSVRKHYAETLQRVLQATERSVQCVPIADAGGESPWSWLLLRSGSDEPAAPAREFTAIITQVADEYSASEIDLVDYAGALRIGILNQQRYWTSSRARLNALRLLEQGFFSAATR